MEKSHSIAKCNRMEGREGGGVNLEKSSLEGSPTLEGGFKEEVSAFIIE